MKDSLEHLARLKDPEARSRLVRMLVLQYSQSTDREPSETERTLFSKIVLCVFDQLDKPTRYELVVRLAKTNRINADLAHRLAQEDFDLSEPVIEHSPSISHATLKELARDSNDRKREAIARRKDLTEEITDTLVAKSARQVVRTLLANLSAPFSSKAIIALMIFANTEADVLADVAQRAISDPRFKSRQMQILETHSPLVPPLLKKALEKGGLEGLAKKSTRGAKKDEFSLDGQVYCRHEASVQIANGELSFDAMLLTLCEQKRMDDAIWLIARKLNLKAEMVRETMKSNSDGAVLVLMLQTGIDDTSFRDFMKARCQWLDRSPRSVPELAMRYKKQLRNTQRPARKSA